MKKALIEGATYNPGAPEGMTSDQVGRLPIRVENWRATIMCVSAWKPSVEELVVLMDGGYVVLSVVGWQPPVKLEVCGPEGAKEL